MVYPRYPDVSPTEEGLYKQIDKLSTKYQALRTLCEDVVEDLDNQQVAAVRNFLKENP